MTIVVAALYKFASLHDYQQMAEPLKQHCESLGLKGTLLLAEEGINGTVAGRREGIDGLLAYLRADERLADLEHKESLHQDMPFYRMKIKLKQNGRASCRERT